MKKYIYLIAFFVVMSLSTISCSDDDDKKKTVINVSLSNAVADNEKKNMTFTLKDTTTLQLKPFFMPRDAKDQTVRYESVFGDIFKVDANGLLVPLKVGVDTLIVRANDNGGAFSKYVINVVSHIEDVTSITLSSAGIDPDIEKGKTLDLKSLVTVLPKTASNNKFTITSAKPHIVSVDENGLLTALGEIGEEVMMTIVCNDYPEISVATFVKIVDKIWRPVYYPRTDWTVPTLSWAYSVDGKTGKPEHMYDDDLKGETFLSIRKPGKDKAPNSQCFFILDMGTIQKVGVYKFQYRLSNKSVNMRVIKGTLYGSADNVTYKALTPSTSFEVSSDINEIKFLPTNLPVQGDYRYLKFTFDEWATSGNTLQISDFYVGYLQ